MTGAIRKVLAENPGEVRPAQVPEARHGGDARGLQAALRGVRHRRPGRARSSRCRCRPWPSATPPASWRRRSASPATRPNRGLAPEEPGSRPMAWSSCASMPSSLAWRSWSLPASRLFAGWAFFATSNIGGGWASLGPIWPYVAGGVAGDRGAGRLPDVAGLLLGQPRLRRPRSIRRRQRPLGLERRAAHLLHEQQADHEGHARRRPPGTRGRSRCCPWRRPWRRRWSAGSRRTSRCRCGRAATSRCSGSGPGTSPPAPRRSARRPWSHRAPAASSRPTTSGLLIFAGSALAG